MYGHNIWLIGFLGVLHIVYLCPLCVQEDLRYLSPKLFHPFSGSGLDTFSAVVKIQDGKSRPNVHGFMAEIKCFSRRKNHSVGA